MKSGKRQTCCNSWKLKGLKELQLLEAEGVKESQINKSRRCERQAAVLVAEGIRKQELQAASGEAEAN